MAQEEQVISSRTLPPWSERVISCRTLAEWNEHFQKGIDSKKLVVVYFTALWCGPCRFITPFVKDLAWKLPSVTFLKVDVDDLESVAKEWEVQVMPTFVFLKEEKLVDKIVGAKKDELQQTIFKHMNTAENPN